MTNNHHWWQERHKIDDAHYQLFDALWLCRVEFASTFCIMGENLAVFATWKIKNSQNWCLAKIEMVLIPTIIPQRHALFRNIKPGNAHQMILLGRLNYLFNHREWMVIAIFFLRVILYIFSHFWLFMVVWGLRLELGSWIGIFWVEITVDGI